MRPQVALAWLMLFFGVPLSGRAVVIVGGGGAINFTNPDAGLPWGNVGASGVYLGNYGGAFWALTAAHVGAGDFVLDSGTYAFVPGSAVRVLNGDSSNTDLTLFRISTDPALTNLNLATANPSTGTTVVFVGDGSIEGPANYWSVAVNSGPNNDVWTDLGGNASGANAAGYLLAAGAGKRWGNALVAGTGTYDVGTGSTASFYTQFVNAAGFSQGAGGDSGGAAFYLSGGTWYLAGIMGAVATFENQPGSAAVLENLTYAGSVASYSGFIMAAIPEPAEIGLTLGLAGLAVVLRPHRLRKRNGADLCPPRNKPEGSGSATS